MTIKDVIDMLVKADGYRVWIVDNADTYAHFSTPKGNIMTISRCYWGNGFHFALDYKANCNCGTGCSCHEDSTEWDLGLVSVTIKGIEKLEEAGLRYARQLKAPMYANVDEFLEYERKFWKDRIKEVV